MLLVTLIGNAGIIWAGISAAPVKTGAKNWHVFRDFSKMESVSRDSRDG